MSDATPLRIAVEKALGEPLDEFVAKRRKIGKSWQAIARNLHDATNHKYRLNRETLRSWFANQGGDVAGHTAETARVPSTFLPMGAVAIETGYSPATIRVLFDRGELEGMRDARGHRFIDPACIADLRDSVTIGEAVRVTGRSAQWVRRRFDEGTLAGFRTKSGNRRIYRSALAELVEEDHAP